MSYLKLKRGKGTNEEKGGISLEYILLIGAAVVIGAGVVVFSGNVGTYFSSVNVQGAGGAIPG